MAISAAAYQGARNRDHPCRRRFLRSGGFPWRQCVSASELVIVYVYVSGCGCGCGSWSRMAPGRDLDYDPNSCLSSLHDQNLGLGLGLGLSHVRGHGLRRARELVPMAVATGVRLPCHHGDTGACPLSYDIQSRGGVTSRMGPDDHWNAGGSHQESEDTPCAESPSVSLRLAESMGQRPLSRLEMRGGETALE